MNSALSTGIKVLILITAIPVGFIIFALLYAPGSPFNNFQHTIESMLLVVLILSVVLFSSKSANGTAQTAVVTKDELKQMTWICPSTTARPHRPIKYDMKVEWCNKCGTRKEEAMAASHQSSKLGGD